MSVVSIQSVSKEYIHNDVKTNNYEILLKIVSRRLPSEVQKPSFSLGICLDRSGSMYGPPLRLPDYMPSTIVSII